MARKWVVNNASRQRMIGGKLLTPGEVTSVDEPEFPSASVKPQLRLALTAVHVAAMAMSGLPVEAGTLPIDPATSLIYGQSDGMDEYEPLSVASPGSASTDFQSATVSLPDLAAVGVATVPAPGTPANEYIESAGAYSFTDGSSIWGQHQHRFVLMSDGTAFAAVLTPTNLVLMRSATGGTYGSAWTTVSTIANSGRSSTDMDAHLLRNPETDQVHLIASSTDSGISRYRIRTYSSAGALVNDYFLPDTWIGSGTAAAGGWFASTISSTTKYSWAAIGDDGMIAFGDSISQGSYLARTYTEYDAGHRMQLLRWNGATWMASQIYVYAVGARMAYHHVAVSPPGRRGYVVGIAARNLKVADWNHYHNPNYPSVGSWPNSDADTTYFGAGAGRYPAVSRWEVSIDSPEAISTRHVLSPDFAATDQSALVPSDLDEYGAYQFIRARIDRAGRWWMQYSKGNRGTLQQDTLVHVCDAFGAPVYTVHKDTFFAAGSVEDFFFDARNKAWVLAASKGGNMVTNILSTTESGGALTVQTSVSAINQSAAAGTVLGANLGTSRFEIFYTTRTPQINNGSVLTNNWFDFIYSTPGDHTGTPPGTAIAPLTDGAVRTKRVRIQVPTT
jgi:hypothetical protein